MRIIFTAKAKKEFEKLDIKYRERIRVALDRIITEANLPNLKKLKGRKN